MGLEKKYLSSKDHTRTARRLHDHTRGKTIQIRNSTKTVKTVLEKLKKM